MITPRDIHMGDWVFAPGNKPVRVRRILRDFIFTTETEKYRFDKLTLIPLTKQNCELFNFTCIADERDFGIYCLGELTVDAKTHLDGTTGVGIGEDGDMAYHCQYINEVQQYFYEKTGSELNLVLKETVEDNVESKYFKES